MVMEQRQWRKAALGALVLWAAACGPALAAPGVQDYDPGVQLSRTREYLERQRVAQQIAEDRAREQARVEGVPTGETAGEDESAIRFTLQEVTFDESTILSEEERSAIAAGYIGREITLSDLYAMVEEINGLYRDKGYLTCRAFLGAQTISGGVVHITLIEGKTGQVHVHGSRFTNESYITHRVGLKEGEPANIEALNEDLLRFNASNDVQLRITMHAGQEPGTTDYVISAFEPQQNLVNVYVDNGGYESSGEWRAGLFYTNRSLTGRRDSLLLSGMRSDGTKSFSAMYTTPIGTKGTKLSVNYAANSVHITDGPLEALDVRGHSKSYGATIIQPLEVTETKRTELTFGYGYQNSRTDFLRIPWVDDTTRGYTLGYSVTDYGQSSIVYQKHNYRYAESSNIAGESQSVNKYFLNSFWQKVYKSGHILSARLDVQWSPDDYLPSAERFYIGGAYTVRGYEESYLSGDSGFAASMEYAIPIDSKKTTSLFCFFDYGEVYGDSAFDDHVLASTGIGIKSTIDRNIFASVTLGIPLMRELNGERVNKTRVHFMMNGQF